MIGGAFIVQYVGTMVLQVSGLYLAVLKIVHFCGKNFIKHAQNNLRVFLFASLPTVSLESVVVRYLASSSSECLCAGQIPR